MDIWKYYKMAFKNAFNFRGRASRMECWLAELMNFIILYILGFVLGFINGYTGESETCTLISVIVIGVYNLITFIPFWSLMVRRYHDTGHRAWWALVPIVNLVLALQKGNPGPNKFDNAVRQKTKIKKSAKRKRQRGIPIILYCPHCHKEYGEETAYCPDCDGRLIVK